jgi:hypothetical protein
MWPLVVFAIVIARPPVGAVYARDVSLPFLGKQRIRLSVDSRSKGTLFMRGALNLEDEVTFVGDGFELGDDTRAMLRRTHTSLRAAYYDDKNDVAVVTVQPPMPMPLTFRLRRDHSVP